MFLWTIEIISALLKVVDKDQAGLSLEDINSLSAHCFLKFLKKRRQFRCTGLLSSSKVTHLDAKNLTFLSKI